MNETKSMLLAILAALAVILAFVSSRAHARPLNLSCFVDRPPGIAAADAAVGYFRSSPLLLLISAAKPEYPE